MKWNELNDVIHDNELDTSDDDVTVYNMDTGDFCKADMIELEPSRMDEEEGLYISIKGDDDEQD
jgi:hypothetical protein